MKELLENGTNVYIFIQKDKSINDTTYLHGTIISNHKCKNDILYQVLDEYGQIHILKHAGTKKIKGSYFRTQEDYLNYIQDKIVKISLEIEELRVERFKACEAFDNLTQTKKLTK